MVKKIMSSIIGEVTVGSLIRGYRHSHEISLDDMARMLKMTKTDLQKIESGKTKIPLKEVVSIAKKLDEPKNVYAKVWCEEEVRSVGIEFDDLTKIF